ncbi:hypothetical protein H0H93_013891, partial [Arthromyces matolae]
MLSLQSYSGISLEQVASLANTDRDRIITDTIQSFLDGINYTPPKSDEMRQQSLADILRKEFAMLCPDDPVWFDTICTHAAAMAELSYQGHSHVVQVQIARFTWMFFYVDDRHHKFPQEIETFQHSLLSFKNSDNSGLRKFLEIIKGMYDLWDTISANCIASSAMEFINGCMLENFQETHNMEISRDAISWPDYLREKTGTSSAYAFFIFPRNDLEYCVTDFIQVIGDIKIYINHVNDLLSFYKEELAGETDNYIHIRAYIQGKSAYDTLADVARESVAAYSRVSGILRSRSPAAYQLWETFAAGYA